MTVNGVPQISVIICSRNRGTALSRCLESINCTEMQDCNAELILVDNGSSDNTLEIMCSFKAMSDFPVHVLEVKEPGLSRARNSGLRRAKGRLLVFTDDDCYLTPGYLRKAIELFNTRDIDYCGGRILLFDPQDSPYGCNLSEEFQLIPPRSFIRAGEIQGANMVMRHSVTDTVGAFDETMGAGSGTVFRCEDIDYCSRASWAGFVGAHVPELAVYHHHGRKAGGDINRLIRENDLARGAYFAKCILAGKFKYLLGWFRRWWPQAGVATLREFGGAALYICFFVKRKVRGRRGINTLPADVLRKHVVKHSGL